MKSFFISTMVDYILNMIYQFIIINKEMYSLQFGMNCQGFASVRLTWPAYVESRKLENSSV